MTVCGLCSGRTGPSDARGSADCRGYVDYIEGRGRAYHLSRLACLVGQGIPIEAMLDHSDECLNRSDTKAARAFVAPD